MIGTPERSRMAPGPSDRDPWLAAAATAGGYALFLAAILVVLFLLPYVMFRLL